MDADQIFALAEHWWIRSCGNVEGREDYIEKMVYRECAEQLLKLLDVKPPEEE